jgi:hypothetical protein
MLVYTWDGLSYLRTLFYPAIAQDFRIPAGAG